MNNIKHIIKTYNHNFIIISMVMLSIAIYYTTTSFGFFSDDYHMLHIVAQYTGSITDIFTTNLLGTTQGHSYGPIFKIAMMVQYALFGTNAYGYHVVSILLHSFVTVLVYMLALRIWTSKGIAIAAGMLFAILPVHVEAVAWVGVQPHLIATVGYVGAIYLFLHYLNTSKQRYYIGSLIAFFFALWSKDTAITLPAAMVLLSLWYRQSKQVNTIPSYQHRITTYIKQIIPYGSIAILYLYVRSIATGSATASYASGSLGIDIHAMWTMTVNIVSSVVVSYPIRQIVADIAVQHIVLTMSLTALLIGIIVYYFRSYRQFPLLIGLSIISMLSLLFVAYNTINDEGERYAYLPSVFIIITLVGLLYYAIQCITKTYANVLYMVCCIVAIFFAYHETIRKIDIWNQASYNVNHIIQNLPILQEHQYPLFIGIPDNILGAQLFRNGLQEGMAIYQQRTREGERIPIYTYMDNTEKVRSDVRLINTGEGQYTLETSDKAIGIGFTGFPVYTTESGTYTLQHWQRNGSLGSHITIALNRAFIQKKQEEGKEVLLVYYANGQLQIQKVQ